MRYWTITANKFIVTLGNVLHKHYYTKAEGVVTVVLPLFA